MTHPSAADVREMARGLSEAQSRFLIEAESIRMNGRPPFVVLDDEAEPLPAEIAQPITGVLSPLGLALRRHLMEPPCEIVAIKSEGEQA